MGVVKDVTERKKVEQALKKSEEKMRHIIEHSNELYYIHDFNHKLTYASPQSLAILGYTPKEMMIKWTELATDSPLNKKGLEITERAMKTGKKQKIYYLELKHKDGRKRLLEIDEAPYRDVNNKVVGIIGAARDITERKLAEEKTLNSAKEWSETFDSMADGVSLHSPDFTIINANRSLSNILGKSREELIGKKCFSIFHDKDRPIEKCPMAVTLKSKQEERAEIFEPKLDKWLSVYTSPIINKNGKIIKIIHVVRDISERKEVEKAANKKNIELEKANRLMVGRELKMIELKKKIKELGG